MKWWGDGRRWIRRMWEDDLRVGAEWRELKGGHDGHE